MGLSFLKMQTQLDGFQTQIYLEQDFSTFRPEILFLSLILVGQILTGIYKDHVNHKNHLEITVQTFRQWWALSCQII